jgi:hypothetical protein
MALQRFRVSRSLSPIDGDFGNLKRGTSREVACANSVQAKVCGEQITTRTVIEQGRPGYLLVRRARSRSDPRILIWRDWDFLIHRPFEADGFVDGESALFLVASKAFGARTLASHLANLSIRISSENSANSKQLTTIP